MSDDDVPEEWRNYKAHGIEGCQELERLTTACCEKAKEFNKVKEEWDAAQVKKDMKKSMDLGKKAKKLHDEIKDLRDKVKIEAERIQAEHKLEDFEDKEWVV